MITPERLAEDAGVLLATERAVIATATRITERALPLAGVAEDSRGWWRGPRSDRFRATATAVLTPVPSVGRAVTDATLVLARTRRLATDLATRLAEIRRMDGAQRALLARARRTTALGRARPDDEHRIVGSIRALDREWAEIEARWSQCAAQAADTIARIAASIPVDPTPARFTTFPGGLLVDPVAAAIWRPNPAAIAQWWAQLTGSSRDAMIRTVPAIVGNLDGVPFADRDEANRRTMQQVLDGAEPGSPTWGSMQQFTDRGDVHLIDPLRRFVVFDPGGDGLVAEVFGDPGRADHVAVLVPGMGSTLANFGDLSRRAARLHQTSGCRAAVIAWTGYDTPQQLAFTPHVLQAASDRQAATGGAALRWFADGIRTQSTGSLTLIGHSYGSLTVAKAMQHGADADRVVFTGSPGVGTDDVTDFPDGPTEYFATEIKGDIVADLEWFGPDPTDPDFGATVFDSGDGDGHDPFVRHGEYYDDGIAIENLAAIVTGASPTPGRNDLIEYVTEPIEDIQDAASRVADQVRASDIPVVDDTLIDGAILVTQRSVETAGQVGEIIIEQVGHFAQDVVEWRFGW
ncbi:MAG: alpha/beta hydrolase [Ilumatobacteraceae bacterium]